MEDADVQPNGEASLSPMPGRERPLAVAPGRRDMAASLPASLLVVVV